MMVSEKIIEKHFSAVTMKEAYLKACKWISSNIIAVNNSQNITYQIRKEKGEFEKRVTLDVYVTVDEREVQERHCEICKEMTGSFFMKQNKYMCESCKLLPYKRRVEEKMRNVKEGLKGKIL